MEIEVLVKTQARRTLVERLPDGRFRVSVNAPPIEGRANAAVCEALAEFFGVPKSRVAVVRGLKSKTKTVEIAD